MHSLELMMSVWFVSVCENGSSASSPVWHTGWE